MERCPEIGKESAPLPIEYLLAQVMESDAVENDGWAQIPVSTKAQTNASADHVITDTVPVQYPGKAAAVPRGITRRSLFKLIAVVPFYSWGNNNANFVHRITPQAGEMRVVQTIFKYLESQGFDVYPVTPATTIPDVVRFGFDAVDETEFGDFMQSQLAVSNVPAFSSINDPLTIRQYARLLIQSQDRDRCQK